MRYVTENTPWGGDLALWRLGNDHRTFPARLFHLICIPGFRRGGAMSNHNVGKCEEFDYLNFLFVFFFSFILSFHKGVQKV